MVETLDSMLIKALEDLNFKEVSIKGTKEKVYGLRIPSSVKELDLSIRVYTSIEEGKVRTVGEDAIRVVLMGRRQYKIFYIAGTKRINRTSKKTLKDRLLGRINYLIKKKIEICSCGGILLEKESKFYGSFLGCSNYPKCKKTKSF